MFIANLESMASDSNPESDLTFYSNVYKKSDAVKYIELEYEFFLSRSTILYGTSGTGKTRIIKHILKLLQPYIPMCTVICPTNDSNRDYSGIIPEGCIKKDITIEKLEKIYKRQEGITRNCNIAKDKKNLMSIFNKLANRNEKELYNTQFEKVKQCIEKIEKSKVHMEKKESMKNQAQDKFYKWVQNECKNIINKNNDNIDDSKFTENELITIEFMDTNPNLLILFDDAVTILADLKKSKPLQDMFYNGRHANITTIISLQNDKGLPPELRTGAFNSMFPDRSFANIFTSTKGNGFSLKDTKYINEIIDRIFASNNEYQKKYFFYRRLGSPKYGYNYVNEPKTFKFGCKAFWKFYETKETREAKEQGKTPDSFQNLINNILDIKK